MTVYFLVQFVDDGILAICTSKDIRTRDDGRKEPQYGVNHYLCTVMFQSGKSSDSVLLLYMYSLEITPKYNTIYNIFNVTALKYNFKDSSYSAVPYIRH